MSTFLLTWNPAKWHWEDDLRDDMTPVRGGFSTQWSCGTTKHLPRGSRVFLMRLGSEPRGIVASGRSASAGALQGRHWQKGRSREKAWYVRVIFDTLLNPAREPILNIGRLKLRGLRQFKWSPRASGTRLPDDVATRLETAWSAFRRSAPGPYVVPNESALEGLATETTTYARGRSRRLRQLALQGSRGVCAGCDVEFAKVLRGKGVRALQVHHKRQLAATDRPRLTRLSDLAVLCANCHAFLHMDSKNALAIRKLRALLRADRHA